MSSKRERHRLLDIVENIQAIFDYTASHSFESFDTDRMAVDATERCLERVCEAAVKIGGDRMAEIAPAAPAAVLRGLGNALRHGYDLIERRMIWNLIRNDLPELHSRCVAELERLHEP